MDYKVVCVIEWSDGHEEHVFWEPELYGKMVTNKIDFNKMFYDTSVNGFKTPPVGVDIGLYENPSLQMIERKTGSMETEEVFQQPLLIGKKVIPLAFY